MATFAELKSDVSKRLLDEDNVAVSSADVATALNKACKKYAAKDPYFMEGSDTTTLTVSDPEITLPADFDTGSFVLVDGDSKYPLEPILPDVYDYMDNGAVGIPQFVMYRSGSYYVYPYPASAYTVNVNYTKTVSDLSGDSDTNVFTLNAPDLIMYEALANLAADFRQDLEMAAKFEEKRNGEWADLLQETNRRRATGSLTI